MTTKKAIKATIMLGSIEIDVYKMPSGEYKLSQTQVARLIEKEENSFREFLRGKSLEALNHKGFRPVKFPASDGNEQKNAIPIKVAKSYWRYHDRKGNAIACALIDACMEETIERRADTAFGIQRTKEEYNVRFATRMDLKKDKYPQLARAIASWLHKEGLYETQKARLWFSRTHDQMNLRIQNITSKEFKSRNNIAESALIRDYYDIPVIIDYSSVTQLAANILKAGSVDPVEAVNLACDIYLPEDYVPSPTQIKENINKVIQQLARMKKNLA